MMAGDAVQWTAEGGTVRIGIYIRPVPAGEMPALPSGIGGRRARFRASLSMRDRAIVRDRGTGLYYAPREDSLKPSDEGCAA